MPAWKNAVFNEDVYLEDVLRKATDIPDTMLSAAGPCVTFVRNLSHNNINLNMKNKILPFLVLALLFGTAAIAQTGNKVIIGTIDSIQSKILNEQRKIWVYVPNNGSGDASSMQRYPVVYLLDGDAHFYSVVGMIQQLSQVNGNTICPEMIVVGIPNTDRNRDLTPTHTAVDRSMGIDSAFSEISGGGEQFMAFIEKELMPYIDATYPTQPYKTLIGHSFGGLMVMDALVNHTKLFNSYICIEPGMWWDKMYFLKTTEKALSENNFAGTTLYLGIANTMEEGMDIKKVQNDSTIETRQIRSILTLDQYIKSQKQNGLRYESKYYSNDDHSSVPMIASYDALRFIFEKYRFKLSRKEFMDSTMVFADKYEKHYADVSQLFGYKVNPPENQINGMGYRFLHMKQYDKANRFFKMNVDNYPKSFNVYDAYGDYFEATGNKPKAMENFRKALSVQESAETRKKLEKLLK